MHRSSVVLGLLSVLAAGVTGVLAYGALAPAPTAPQSVVLAPPAAATAAAAPAPRVTVRYRPCAHGTKLVHGVCVRHVVRTVVIPQRSTALPAVPVANVSVRQHHQAPATSIRHHQSAGHADGQGHDDEASHDQGPGQGGDDGNEPSDDNGQSDDGGGDD